MHGAVVVHRLTILHHLMDSLGQLRQYGGANSGSGITWTPGVSLSSQHNIAICRYTGAHFTSPSLTCTMKKQNLIILELFIIFIFIMLSMNERPCTSQLCSKSYQDQQIP